MRIFGKILVGTALCGAMVASDVASARPWGWGPPPPPRYYGRHYHRGGDALGNFLLGAGLVGAIAVIASSNRNDDREVHTVRDTPPPAPVYRDETPPPPPPPPARRDDYSYNDSGSRYERDAAVNACKVAAEREGERYSSRVRVDNVEDVRSQREGGYRVTGVVAIDKAGYNGESRNGDQERARFDCTSDGGRVVAFRLGSSAEMAQRY